MFDKDFLYQPDAIDTNTTEEIFLLKIDNEPKYVSKFLITMLRHISELKWTEINWSIIPLK